MSHGDVNSCRTISACLHTLPSGMTENTREWSFIAHHSSKNSAGVSYCLTYKLFISELYTVVPLPPGWKYLPTEVFRNLQVQKYSRLAAMVIVFYDGLITMDREVQYVWKKRNSPMKLIYIVIRYWGLFVVVVDTWSKFTRDSNIDHRP
ncbi:hypothetical protein SCHPADRAFT_25754 [Schizopora paradoxa]|uniref:DUF6533 domain-containing protein n=1 Tax=Schizopora paradoxa TaxID=27342 RepID=A0A0H2SSE3_9AGAM|nr:hypothetical protein SCHPADRAFT_25754 [Schizopora paradoxa]